MQGTNQDPASQDTASQESMAYSFAGKYFKSPRYARFIELSLVSRFADRKTEQEGQGQQSEESK